MKTDKQFYKLFTTAPKLAFELLGEDPPVECTGQSIKLKEIEQEIDLLLIPGSSGAWTVLEPQFYEDDTIYARTVHKMSWLQLRHNMRPVRGVILFRYEHQDPKTEPWVNSVRSVLLRDAVNDLAKRDPNHALLGLFQPLLVTNDDTLERMIPTCYNKIHNSVLEVPIKQVLIDLLFDWLMHRFPNKSKKEFQSMFEEACTDVRETQVGKDLIAEGREEGILETKTRSIVRVLKSRFQRIPKKLEKRILTITDNDLLDELLVLAATCASLNDFTF